MKQSYVYIMTNKPQGTLYIGVTSDLIKRIWQHKNNVVKGFTFKYNLHHLAYYEVHEDIVQAIKREKNIKAWKREWKLRLIEEVNPRWVDLYGSLF